MNNIKVIILKNGLELISEISEHGTGSERSIVMHRPVKNVLVPIPIPTPEGMKITFTGQLMPLTSIVMVKEVPLDPYEIWMMMDAPKELEMGYLQMTSGIKIAPASAIIKG